MKQRIDYRYFVFIFKVMHGLGPDYLASLLKWYRPNRNLRSEDKYLLEAGKKIVEQEPIDKRFVSVLMPRELCHMIQDNWRKHRSLKKHLKFKNNLIQTVVLVLLMLRLASG